MRSLPLRHSLLPFLVVLALCTPEGVARAQATSGSIGVGAVILAPAPGGVAGPLHLQPAMDGKELAIRGEPANPRMPTTIFLRAQLAGASPGARTFIGQSIVAGREARVRVPGDARHPDVQLERLILAGT